MRIYTRKGDDGRTGLFGGRRVSKADPLVDAYGAVDELNAVLGRARSAGLPEDLDGLAGRLQTELFVVGADLATPLGSERVGRLEPKATEALEREIDAIEAQLEPLRNFILPGGCPAGAELHVARTVCRRAERRATQLAQQGAISAPVLPYLNRLSDLLFVMARLANARAKRTEQAWVPR